MEYLSQITEMGMGEILLILFVCVYFLYRMYSQMQQAKEEQAQRNQNPTPSVFEFPNTDEASDEYYAESQEKEVEVFSQAQAEDLPYFTYESLKMDSLEMENSLPSEAENKKTYSHSILQEEEELTTEFDLQKAIIYQTILEKKYV
ncbi:MAG: hypothetical protein RR190_03040 [Bacteroidales bacterium]